jgi:hypothetical protein
VGGDLGGQAADEAVLQGHGGDVVSEVLQSFQPLTVFRFDMMLGYGDLGPFLSVFSILSLVLYFVTR